MNINDFERIPAFKENDPYGEYFYLKDPNTNNIYERKLTYSDDNYKEEIGNLIASGKAIKDPDIQLLGISDPERAQYFYDLKQKNPDEYYKEYANQLTTNIYDNWKWNQDGYNYPLYKKLEEIKQENPNAYYSEKIDLLSKFSGWQHGQNTYGKAQGWIDEIQRLIPEAQKSGLSSQQIDKIWGTNFASASGENQTRIVNELASGGGGFNLGELVRGIAPVIAMPFGAMGLESLLAGGSAVAAAPAATSGAQTGNAMLASLGLGAEAAAPFTAAAGLPANLFTLAPGAAGTASALSLGDDLAQLMQTYPNMSVEQLKSIAEINYGLNPTTAFDAANLAASGYNPATINQVLGYSYTPTELAGTGIESFIPSQIPQYPGDDQYIQQDIQEQARATNVPSGSPTSWDTGVSSFITPGMALQGASLATGLLSGGQQQQQQMAQMPRQNIMPRGQGVDYSGIYNLLSLQRPTNPNSLLG